MDCELPERYEYVGELGAGGQGRVVEARDQELDRLVAIKLLSSASADATIPASEALLLFDEARTTAGLDPQRFVTIYEVVKRPQPCIVMELLEGETLEERLLRGPIPWREALPLMKQVLQALRFVHDRGRLHLDLKPANLFLIRRDGELAIKVLDLGIAQPIGSQVQALRGRVGTPAYWAPEQFSPNALPPVADSWTIGVQTDLFAAGLVFYEMLAGEAPYAVQGQGPGGGAPYRHNAFTANALQVDRAPPMPATTGTGSSQGGEAVPAALEARIALALRIDPASRYPTANAFLAALEKFEDDDRKQREEVEERWKRRAWAVGGVVAFLAALAGPGLLGAWIRHQDPDPPHAIRRVFWDEPRTVERCHETISALKADSEIGQDQAFVRRLDSLAKVTDGDLCWSDLQSFARGHYGQTRNLPGEP